MHLVNIGYGNMVHAERVVTVVAPEAAPIRRMISDARDRGHVIDATCGHKTPGIWYYVDHTPTDKQCVEFADLMMEQWNNGE